MAVQSSRCAARVPSSSPHTWQALFETGKCTAQWSEQVCLGDHTSGPEVECLMGCSSSVTSAWLKESPAVLKEVIYSVPLKFGLVIAGSGVSVVNKLRTDIFNSVQSLNRLGGWGGGGHEGRCNRDPLPVFSAEGPCEQFLHGQKSLVFDVVHPAWRMVLERLSWRVTCPNYASFRLLKVAGRGSCGPIRKLILFRTQSLVLCSK